MFSVRLPPWLTGQPGYNPPRLIVRFGRMAQWTAYRAPGWWEKAKPLVVMAGITHLALVVLLSGGRNALFDWRAPENLAYTTYFNLTDGFGFWVEPSGESYIRYKMYTQEGTVNEGHFPDPDTAPGLRYVRWAKAVNLVNRGDESLRASLSRYIADQVPSMPFRIKLYASQWEWRLPHNRFPPSFVWEKTEVEETLLGNHNGLTRSWVPVAHDTPADKGGR
ncbi:MAG: hypothetical protein OEW12_00115 [Deltaproteobacteria bacterium]|nr:hypothetical protein [Deltaproteobacteria bacterium]